MRKFLAGSALAAILAGSLMAQPQFGGPRDSVATIENRVSHLTALLTLTPAQVAQATTIFTNAQASAATLQTTLNTDRTTLRAAVKTNSTSTIDQLAASIGALTGQITAIQYKAEAAFYAILTPAQQTALGAAGGGGRRGPGGPGPARAGRGAGQ